VALEQDPSILEGDVKGGFAIVMCGAWTHPVRAAYKPANNTATVVFGVRA
jgi:hypothetical protein